MLPLPAILWSLSVSVTTVGYWYAVRDSDDRYEWAALTLIYLVSYAPAFNLARAITLLLV